MRKTKQSMQCTVEYTVEGPNKDGRYTVTGPDGVVSGWYFQGDFDATARGAIQKHIDSGPKIVEFEGYLIGPLSGPGSDLGAWALDDWQGAEAGTRARAHASSAEYAYQRLVEWAPVKDLRQYLAPLLALAHYLEQGDDL